MEGRCPYYNIVVCIEAHNLLDMSAYIVPVVVVVAVVVVVVVLVVLKYCLVKLLVLKNGEDISSE